LAAGICNGWYITPLFIDPSIIVLVDEM
jgi:hypothetical protein